jgi:hypothetical protein
VSAARRDLPASPPPPGASPVRRIAADLLLGGILGGAWLRSLGRRRRVRRDQDDRKLASGEVIVAYPEQLWRDERSQAARAAIRLVAERMRRWEVTIGESRRVERPPLRGLTRTYVRVGVEPGLEDDVVRAVKVAAWRFRLPRGRSGVLVVRSPLIVPAWGVDPPGTITFQEAYLAARKALGTVSAEGATVLVVDVDRPYTEYLPDQIAERVEVLDDPAEPPRQDKDGHATLMTAIVGDVAPGARIKTRSIGDEHRRAGLWALLEVLMDEQDADVIVASLSAPEGKSKDNRARGNIFESSLRSRRHLPSHPPVLFPTGNHNQASEEGIDTLAIPARFDSVIAIGAADPRFGPAQGSRYGSKCGDDPSGWWLAPGGAFGESGITEPMATMGDAPQAGTSVANAIAAGLLAVAAARLRARQLPADPTFEAAIAALKEQLQKVPGAQEPLTLAEAIRARHTGAVTFEHLVAELDQLACTDCISAYEVLKCGRGHLHCR